MRCQAKRLWRIWRSLIFSTVEFWKGPDEMPKCLVMLHWQHEVQSEKQMPPCAEITEYWAQKKKRVLHKGKNHPDFPGSHFTETCNWCCFTLNLKCRSLVHSNIIVQLQYARHCSKKMMSEHSRGLVINGRKIKNNSLFTLLPPPQTKTECLKVINSL